MARDDDNGTEIPVGSASADDNDRDNAPPETESRGARNGHKNTGHDGAADDGYVGYGHPPRRYQFKPGQSGNRKGRPKGARGMKSMLRKELGARVQVTENGKRRSITKMEVLIKRLVEQAAKGDVKSISKLIELGQMVYGMEDEANGTAPLTADEQAIIDGLMARRARSSEPKPLASSDDNKGDPKDGDDTDAPGEE